MTELSLHILDIVQNSIVAKASLINIIIDENLKNDELMIQIIDNGNGMNQDELKRATDPFYTTRTTRKVGLGLSLFKQAAIRCSGSFTLESEPKIGTKIKATMQHSHIDRQPLGDIAGVIALLASSNPSVDFIYKHSTKQGEYIFDTREIKAQLSELSISNPKINKFLRAMIRENLHEIKN